MAGGENGVGTGVIAQGLATSSSPFNWRRPGRAAAIARTSVAIKSGGNLQVTSLIHSAALLIAALRLAPVISRARCRRWRACWRSQRGA
ncbi:MAG: hypothetical protein U0521_12525 [Anaerolineae bacterium]